MTDAWISILNELAEKVPSEISESVSEWDSSGMWEDLESSW